MTNEAGQSNNQGLNEPPSYDFFWEEISIVPSRLECMNIRDSISALSPADQLLIWQQKLNYLLSITSSSTLQAQIETLLHELDSAYFINSEFESNNERLTFIQNWESETMDIVSPTDFLVMFQLPYLINFNSYTLDWPPGLPTIGDMQDCECSAKSDYCDPFWVNTGTHCDLRKCMPPGGGCGTLYLYKCNGVCAVS